jgi:hypothetical protein
MPLDLTIKPSRHLIVYISILFILALIRISISSALEFSTRFELIIVLLLVTFYGYKKSVTSPVSGLKVLADDDWELRLENQAPVAVKLYGECIVTHYLIWLNFKTLSGSKFYLMLLRDSANKDDLRLLRIRLRFLQQN